MRNILGVQKSGSCTQRKIKGSHNDFRNLKKPKSWIKTKIRSFALFSRTQFDYQHVALPTEGHRLFPKEISLELRKKGGRHPDLPERFKDSTQYRYHNSCTKLEPSSRTRQAERRNFSTQPTENDTDTLNLVPSQHPQKAHSETRAHIPKAPHASTKRSRNTSCIVENDVLYIYTMYAFPLEINADFGSSCLNTSSTESKVRHTLMQHIDKWHR